MAMVADPDMEKMLEACQTCPHNGMCHTLSVCPTQGIPFDEGGGGSGPTMRRPGRRGQET